MDRIFTLHADHGRTLRRRRCGWRARPAPIRSPASPPALPAVGTRAWRANEAALKMLGEIGSVDRIPEYIKRSKTRRTRSA